MAEGNYPFSSTYITFSVGPGYIALPPWPMRVACAKGNLGGDLGVKVIGDVSSVLYNVSIGTKAAPRARLSVAVDWNESRCDARHLETA